MHKFVIEGGAKLKGRVKPAGAKNAILPMLAASLMAKGKTVLKNVSELEDVNTMCNILRFLGMEIKREPHLIQLEVKDDSNYEAPYEFVREMRASFCVFGPLLARRKKAIVAIPGGCVIGERPVDLHIAGFKKLGAEINDKQGYFIGTADKLTGTTITLLGSKGPTVTGTANVMMAATLAEGTTIIHGAAREPEVQELAHLLNKMGARISGIGSDTLVIEGVEELHGVEYEIPPDRIEIGTFICAAGITGGEIIIEDAVSKNLGTSYIDPIIEVFKEIGLQFEFQDSALCVKAPEQLNPINVVANPYPGFPTDLQPQISAVLTIAKGVSIVTDRVFPKRFTHVPELIRMSASIKINNGSALINGVEQLQGAPVVAPDIRAGAALVIAGLAASGKTEILNVRHIDRGYQAIEEKLQMLGANIKRVPL